PVAIKVLDARLASDETVRKRFEREALTAARLSGEAGMVTIFDVGEWKERPTVHRHGVRPGPVSAGRAAQGWPAAPSGRAPVARGSGPRARRRARARDRPPRRQALQPAARRAGPDPRRRLRRSERGGLRLAHADGHGDRHRGLPLAGAGAGTSGDTRE